MISDSFALVVFVVFVGVGLALRPSYSAISHSVTLKKGCGSRKGPEAYFIVLGSDVNR